MARTPDADQQARKYIDRTLELQRRHGYAARVPRKRYEAAVARTAATFRELIDASLGSKGRAA